MLYLPPDPKEGQLIRASTITAILKYLRSITPRTGAFCDVQIGSGGATFRPKFSSGGATSLLSGQGAWPWKVYNTTKGSTGQVQVNGGDGFVASLNSIVAQVNGTDNDTQTGSPPAYPQLAVTGNGSVYGHIELSTAAGPPPVTTITALSVLFATGDTPDSDTANPQTYYNWLLATISGYTTDGSGNVSFNVANATNFGWTDMLMCAGTVTKS